MKNKVVKKNSAKGCLIGIAIFIAALILMVVVIASLKSGSDKKETVTKEDVISLRFNDDGSFKLDSKRGTDEAVMEIYNKAKEDSDTYDNIPTIIENMNNYMVNPWKDENTMEQLIYFGTVIDNNKYSNDKEKIIGNKFVTVVKYVYRGAETKEEAEVGKNILMDKLKEYRK